MFKGLFHLKAFEYEKATFLYDNITVTMFIIIIIKFIIVIIIILIQAGLGASQAVTLSAKPFCPFFLIWFPVWNSLTKTYKANPGSRGVPAGPHGAHLGAGIKTTAFLTIRGTSPSCGGRGLECFKCVWVVQFLVGENPQNILELNHLTSMHFEVCYFFNFGGLWDWQRPWGHFLYTHTIINIKSKNIAPWHRTHHRRI